MQYAENLPSYALPLPGHVRQIQFKLFEWVVLRGAYLVAVNHPRPVYYNLWLEEFMGSFRVRKESRISGRKPDRRAWAYDTFEDSEKEFDRKLKDKTNPFRKSPRKYTVAGNELEIAKKSKWSEPDALRGPIPRLQAIRHRGGCVFIAPGRD